MARMNQDELMEALWKDVVLGKMNYTKVKGMLQTAWKNGHEAAEANLERLNELAALKIVEVAG